MILTVFVTGCHPTQPFYFAEDGDLSHYVGRATEIAYPDVKEASLNEVDQASAPFTLDNDRFDEIWELTLPVAMKIALSNSKVMRNLGGRVDAASEQLLRNPDIAQTVYNPALQESSIGLTQPIGPEAALAAFDADFSASMLWQKGDQITNLTGGDTAGFIPQTFQQQDTAAFNAQVSKTTTPGTTLTFGNSTTYELNNNRVGELPTAANPGGSFGRLFPSEFRTSFQAELRQPLLQGAGVEYNRIAGPFSPRTGVGTRAFDGVVLARINTDRSLADFEAGVRDLVRDIEISYWELYFSYRNLEARKVGLNSSLKTWQNAQSLAIAGQGGQEREALAREQYFSFRAQVETAKSDLFAIESRLRFLMGLATTDGRFIRPANEPSSAKLAFEWHDIVGEALCRNVDLRKQRWQVKRRELEMIAAKNHLLPRLDFVGRYRWNGFGDRLIDPGNGFSPIVRDDVTDPAALDRLNSFRKRFDNAFGNLLDGDFQEWELGLELDIPIGFRQELAGLRNAQLSIQRDKAVLKEQELELSHLLAESIRQADQQFQLIETNFNRRVAAETQVETFQAKVEIGIGRSAEQLDLLLDAQRRLADAEAAYFRAVVDYSRAITLLNYHKGSLLENNNIWLAEGPWPGKAYFDAVRLARQRDASMYLDYGFTRPGVVSRGPYQQHAGSPAHQGLPLPSDFLPQAEPELLPTPDPERAEPPADSPRVTYGQSILRHEGVTMSGPRGTSNKFRRSTSTAAPVTASDSGDPSAAKALLGQFQLRSPSNKSSSAGFRR